MERHAMGGLGPEGGQSRNEYVSSTGIDILNVGKGVTRNVVPPIHLADLRQYCSVPTQHIPFDTPRLPSRTPEHGRDYSVVGTI